MKINIINQMSYNKKIAKTTFKKTNNATSTINNQYLKTPTPNQMQAFWGVEFKGINTEPQDLFNNRTSDKNVLPKEQGLSASSTLKPAIIKIFAKILNDKMLKQIEIFTNILGDKMPEMFAYALTIQDEDGKTPLHTANPDEIKVFAETLGDNAPEILSNLLTIQDKDGKTPLHTANSDKIKAFRKALGDKAPETFAKVLAMQNKDGNTPLYVTATDIAAKNSDTRATTKSDKNKTYSVKAPAEAALGGKTSVTHNKTTKTGTSKSALLKKYFFERTSIEDIKKVFGSNPDELEEFILEERDYPALDLATPRQIQVFSEILGDRAPEIIEKALPMQSISGKTPLHDPNHNKVEVFAWILGDKAPEIFAKLLTVQNKDGNTPLHWAGPYKIKALAEALKDKAPEVFAEVLKIQDKDGNTPLHLANANEDSIFIKALRDKAPEILPKLLAIQNKDGNTPLHLAGPHSIEVYAKALGANTDKIFDKILLIKNNHGMLAIYPSGCHPDKLIALNNAAPSAIKRALKEKYGSETYKDIWLHELKDRCDTYIKFIQHPRLVWFDETDYKANYDSWKKFLDELAK